VDAWTSHGTVLRWWRSAIAGLTQQQAADRLNVQPSALSNWERGTRAISLDLEEVDAALRGDRALHGLLWALGSPDGIEPGRVWTKVFAGPSAPVWMWLRARSPSIEVAAEWGVARMETTLEVSPNGTFVTVGASLPDSPVVVQASEPVWADFGWGELPEQLPGSHVIRALSLLIPSSADGAFMQLFRTNLAARLLADSDDPRSLAGQLPASALGFAQTRGATSRHPPLLWPPSPEGIDAVERARYTRLRNARKLSFPGLSNQLARTTGVEVSRDTLRRFETDVGHPHDPLLPVALDHALGAEGRLAVLQIRSGQGSAAVRFPPYWHGPVWLALTGPGGEGSVELQRGNWHRMVPFNGETLVSFHWFDGAVSLRISAEPSISWAVGVGRRAGATPIDQNWTPGSYDVARDAVRSVEQAILTAADRVQAHKIP
jgi:transcriptional regulator with XRE-family HTH domain